VKRKSKPQQTPNQDPRTIGDLAKMVREIVASRGKGENRIDYADHPLRPAILDAFHLAMALDPCRRVAVNPDGSRTGGRIAPPDPVTGLKSNALNRLAVLLVNVLNRMKRCEGDAGENADLLAIADALNGGKALARRHRRPPLTPKDRPLSTRQAEVVQIVGECKGDLAEAARRLGIDRASLKESYDAGMEKLAKAGIPTWAYILKPKTVALPVDRRGGVTVAKDRRR